jgi:mannose-6-phosphate isomerase-like protein (cupin superfamily)
MGSRAFVIAGGHAALIANDVNDFRYHAAAHYVPVGVQVPVRSHDRAETQFVVEDGVIEFMIGGAAGLVLAGDFVRVPAGVPYAYRNAGETTARLLVRAVNPGPAQRALKVTADFAA